ncbi:MAG TPA: MarR family transcriptional regulator [Lachnospiraceae bacterium]|nr:MarR family transcriptional regulator [Lachnospiraceae bacterium]MDD7664797.1 MarR family transcriptional regulator [Lachnospiraceae bacterium]MDY4164250.1 MarR family transcriptional regulator [Lachnospiraceae bacterium]HAP03766.1 MarR family transcriptional regulator [Lachnospiraceae bacterium]
MLEEVLHNVYSKLRLHFYTQVYSKFENREATLTTVETFSMEAITTLNHPTVAQFASAMNISAPNAAYRVASLIKKGYLKKIQSKKDLRTYYLEPTTKYEKYNQINEAYIKVVANRVKERFSEKDYNKFTEMLDIIDKELMTDVDFITKGSKHNDSTEEGRKNN